LLSASNSEDSSIAKAVVFETPFDPDLQQVGKVVGQNRSQTRAIVASENAEEKTEISGFS
jgi:hypothetical protein